MVRRAKVVDIPQLVDKMFEFYVMLRDEKGAKDIAQDNGVLKGGVIIELGNGFCNPDWFIVLADRSGELVAFMIGILEFCSPVSEHLKCVRIHGNYLDENSLGGPRLLTTMWSKLNEWAYDKGAGYYYANIHPGNASSIRAAKHIKFKHHYTQFFKHVEKPEE